MVLASLRCRGLALGAAALLVVVLITGNIVANIIVSHEAEASIGRGKIQLLINPHALDSAMLAQQAMNSREDLDDFSDALRRMADSDQRMKTKAAAAAKAAGACRILRPTNFCTSDEIAKWAKGKFASTRAMQKALKAQNEREHVFKTPQTQSNTFAKVVVPLALAGAVVMACIVTIVHKTGLCGLEQRKTEKAAPNKQASMREVDGRSGWDDEGGYISYLCPRVGEILPSPSEIESGLSAPTFPDLPWSPVGGSS